MKIYAITKGEYSDYHICALTVDKDRAKKLKEMFSEGGREANIEEYEDGAIETMDLRWCVDLETFDVVAINKNSAWWECCDELDFAFGRAYVKAKDKEHARKKAQDMIPQYYAERQGL